MDGCKTAICGRGGGGGGDDDDDERLPVTNLPQCVYASMVWYIRSTSHPKTPAFLFTTHLSVILRPSSSQSLNGCKTLVRPLLAMSKRF